MVAPKISNPNPWNLKMLLHLEKRVFTDVIKNLEMRSPWINCMGPKCHHKCPYERGIEEDLTAHRRGGRNVIMEVEFRII